MCSLHWHSLCRPWEDLPTRLQSTSATAKSIAQKALRKAKAAQRTANSAKSKANTALSNAASAQTSANGAQNTADNALSAANAAQSDANAAQTSANAAQSSADAANANANNRLQGASFNIGTANPASGTNTTDTKSASVECPSNQVILGGGYFVNGNSNAVTVTRSQPAVFYANGWAVTGEEIGGTPSWSIRPPSCAGSSRKRPSDSHRERGLPRGGPSHAGASPPGAWRARSWMAPAAIVLLALVIRGAVVIADSGYEPANDALEYDFHAQSIAAGDGYKRSIYLLQGGPTAVRGPGFPYFLGGIYALSGDSIAAGRLAGAALGALAVLLLYLIAKRIWGRRVGLLAAGLAAAFPPLVFLSRDLLSESLFIVLRARRHPLRARLPPLRRNASLGGSPGALCGLAALTRNTGLVLVLAIALGVWTGTPRLRLRSLAGPAVAVACAVLVIAPWTVRNAIEFGRFIPLTTSPGIAASGTYNQYSYLDGGTHGAWRDPQIVPTFTPLFVTPGIDEGTVDATLRREARDFAWEHPGYVAETSLWNLLRMFEVVGGSVVGVSGDAVDDRGIGSAVPTSERAGLAAVVALAVIGVLAILSTRPRLRGEEAGRRRVPAGPLFIWLIPVGMIVTAMPIAGLPRYRLPADPFLLILAAIGLVWLRDLARERLPATP